MLLSATKSRKNGCHAGSHSYLLHILEIPTPNSRRHPVENKFITTWTQWQGLLWSPRNLGTFVSVDQTVDHSLNMFEVLLFVSNTFRRKRGGWSNLDRLDLHFQRRILIHHKHRARVILQTRRCPHMVDPILDTLL